MVGSIQRGNNGNARVSHTPVPSILDYVYSRIWEKILCRWDVFAVYVLAQGAFDEQCGLVESDTTVWIIWKVTNVTD